MSRYDEWIQAYRASLAPASTMGKCGAATAAMKLEFPELEIVRGHVFDAQWGMRQHHWLVNGEEIIDPTADQFPALVDYEPYTDGDPLTVGRCCNCGEPIFAYSLAEAERVAGQVLCGETCERSYARYLMGGAL